MRHYEVRYLSEMFGITALHSVHKSPELAQKAALEFAVIVKKTPMEARSKSVLLNSIRVL